MLPWSICGQHLSYEERLKKLGLSGKKRVQGEITAAFLYLKGVYKDEMSIKDDFLCDLMVTGLGENDF